MGPGMPMMFPPPPPPQPRKPVFGTLARTVFTTLASLILLGSITLNLYLLALLAASTTADIKTRVLEEGKADEVIAVLPIEGMILDESSDTFEKMIRQVEKDANVKAILLEIDTPGGAVTASDEIYHRINRFQADHPGTPVVVSMRSLATSGGYYIACAADHVFAQQSTMTGNIGVMMPRFNLSKWANEHGIEDNSLHSTGADFKTAGSMWKAETPEERAYIQGLIDEAFSQFKHVVREGRGQRLDPSSDETLDQKLARIANGKVYMAPEALKLGLIDAIGYRSDALAYVKQAASLNSPKVVLYEKPDSLLSLFRSQSNLGGQAGGLVNVQLDARLIEQLTRPRLMYLWRVN
jgi:protease-4